MQSTRSFRRAIFITLMLVMVAATVASTAYLLWRLRSETLHREANVASLTARTLEDHLTYSLSVADRSMLMAAEQYQGSEWLPLFMRQTPFVRSLSLADMQGRVFASSNDSNLGTVVARAPFWPDAPPPVEALRVGRLQDGRDLFQARPLNEGEAMPPVAFLPLARDVLRPDGRWLTVLATLNTDYFLNFYSSHISEARGQVALLRFDGSVLFSTRDGKSDFSEVIRKLEQSEAGAFRLGTSGTPDARLVAYRASANYPFVLVVSLDEAYALRAWRNEMHSTGWTVALLLLLMLALASWYYWHYERISRMREQDAADLRIAAAAFEAQEGMFITDVQGKILRVNRAFCKITGYEAQEVVGRSPKLFSSGRHDAAFYQAMWLAIARHGVWQGEIWNRRKSGEIYPEWLTITAVRDAQGEVSHYVSTLMDITQRKQAEDEIRHLAFYDPLTNLPNRRLLRDRLQQALQHARQHQRGGALLFLDLDNFKNLNDTLGHDKGDLLLQQVGQRLLTCVREDDTVSRQGGDEFVVLLDSLGNRSELAARESWLIAERIRLLLGERYDLAGHEYICTPSIGIALFSEDIAGADELLKHADLALYSAKAAGRNCIVFFDPAMQAAASQRTRLESELRRAWELGEFELYYQQQSDSHGKPLGAEVLLRWRHPERGMVSPAEFIPQLEESGLIIPVGWWVIDSVCQVLRRWQDDPQFQSLHIAVNVSARQLSEPDFVGRLTACLQKHATRACKLELELTESMLLDHVEDTIIKMSELRALGIGFALDDFGTGYSSLAYLKRLPLSQLKIDKSFVNEVLDDGNAAAIARSIIGLAHSLGLTVLAEGVETSGQQQFLAGQGCDAYQGYLFGRPQPLAVLEQQMRASLLAVDAANLVQ